MRAICFVINSSTWTKARTDGYPLLHGLTNSQQEQGSCSGSHKDREVMSFGEGAGRRSFGFCDMRHVRWIYDSHAICVTLLWGTLVTEAPQRSSSSAAWWRHAVRDHKRKWRPTSQSGSSTNQRILNLLPVTPTNSPWLLPWRPANYLFKWPRELGQESRGVLLLYLIIIRRRRTTRDTRKVSLQI